MPSSEYSRRVQPSRRRFCSDILSAARDDSPTHISYVSILTFGESLSVDNL
jgi:hypothetical protein